ncbi:tannase/feruloyl esterase family alpha/beta hydrolase [Solimonas terrae]|uniref:Tannase/feruloyl esterase family alpha/beta hydrolase n=1 Tax=Solimonas terrae TaxID=1396819 RepID=A0A6M2BM24_9GAMM|nr:tannase/feruloyl esterase family alpha/beta hydrolase [Solimonas terrae]NGY03311.1 tannase/feruloyl esterase family alpha/beta hydrolase [Solimonas terrae]
MIRKVLPVLVLLAIGACADRQIAGPCKQLRDLQFEHAHVVSATADSGGREFSLIGLFIGLPFFHEPPSCRVELEITPVPDSTIRADVWLPAKAWNGKLQGIGNGGFAGSIDKLSLRYALQQGYAAAATDTGHEANDRDGRWALGHPEKIRDYGDRAIHETALHAKELITAYYGRQPEHAYFGSCSNGGREGLMEAQRYPDDYDGILAGAPAMLPTVQLPAWAWTQQQLQKPGAYIPSGKWPAIAAATLAACDTLDGVKDGVIDDPRRCHFDPAALQCKGPETDSCLTTPQQRALRAIYSGPDERHHGFMPGGELGKKGGAAEWFSGDKPHKSIEYGYAQDFYRYLVYDDPRWSLDSFDIKRDEAAMYDRLHAALDADDPDLTRFAAHGGKLILFHGWNDPALQPQITIDYYENLRARMGGAKTDDFVRLYMVPGLQHCIGGPGPNVFGGLPPGGHADPRHNISAALEAWVEQAREPGPIIATKYDSDLKPLLAPEKAKAIRSRPLCPYPQAARWNGNSSPDDASSFSCALEVGDSDGAIGGN